MFQKLVTIDNCIILSVVIAQPHMTVMQLIYRCKVLVYAVALSNKLSCFTQAGIHLLAVLETEGPRVMRGDYRCIL